MNESDKEIVIDCMAHWNVEQKGGGEKNKRGQTDRPTLRQTDR